MAVIIFIFHVNLLGAGHCGSGCWTWAVCNLPRHVAARVSESESAMINGEHFVNWLKITRLCSAHLDNLLVLFYIRQAPQASQTSLPLRLNIIIPGPGVTTTEARTTSMRPCWFQTIGQGSCRRTCVWAPVSHRGRTQGCIFTFPGVCHVTNHINTTRSQPYSFRTVQKVTRHLQTLLLKDIAEMALSERKCGVSGKQCSLASETLSTLLLPSPRASYPCRRSAGDAAQLFKNSNFLRDKLDQTAMCSVHSPGLRSYIRLWASDGHHPLPCTQWPRAVWSNVTNRDSEIRNLLTPSNPWQFTSFAYCHHNPLSFWLCVTSHGAVVINL
mgnify:CR=1 FL=1